MKRFYNVYLNGKNISFVAAEDPTDAYRKVCKVNKFDILTMHDVSRGEWFKVTRIKNPYGKSNILTESL